MTIQTRLIACCALATVAAFTLVGCQVPGSIGGLDGLQLRMADAARASLIDAESAVMPAPHHSEDAGEHVVAKPVIQMIGYAGCIDRS